MSHATPSRRMVEHALLLIGRSHKARPDIALDAQAQLQHWRSIDEAHAQAFAAAQHLWDSTDGAALQSDLALPRSHAERQAGRRRMIATLGIGGFAAALAVGGGRWYRAQPVFQLALASGQGQLQEHTLPDGTVLNLAARTSGSVALYRDRREIRLNAGEILLQVRPDPDRPFTVATDWGRVRVLGTTFSVSAGRGHMRVAVVEGRVAVWPAQADGRPIEIGAEPAAVLGAGSTIETDARGAGPQRSVDAGQIAAWRQGWLVFDNTRLDEALARWNDYLRQPLRLGSAPGLAALRLSGSFPLRNPQAFLRGLPDMLPVRVVHASNGDISIEAR
ncbi:iron dicitrate transport regulator FecR [Xylophilus rhododendri]|uniref:Iron dicitrate transport regulator FecR n=1 Tax=Xylophilus rhododendri TaxID=2697032 RepID=A0A857JCI0_9BURK|nr:FecR domain-containing protein [Xylophilus rhododendri]QHJ00449.1 iron dicitrate transport regulator FecR [Xylophilus rhododendri]